MGLQGYEKEASCVSPRTYASRQVEFVNHQVLSSRQACQYGENCIRKNPLHFKEFAHPRICNPKGIEKQNPDLDFDEAVPASAQPNQFFGRGTVGSIEVTIYSGHN